MMAGWGLSILRSQAMGIMGVTTRSLLKRLGATPTTRRPAMIPVPTTDALRNAIESDRAYVWHHLLQHKPFEMVDPRVYVEGKGLRLWDAPATSTWTQSRVASGRSTSATGGRASPTRSATS